MARLLFLFLFFEILHAQVPSKMSYQAIVRNSAGDLLVNSPISLKISIIQGEITNSAVYTELHGVMSSEMGLISIEVGGGNILIGVFDSINWSNGPFFLQSEIDPQGGNNYTISTVSQLLSVPYALQARVAERIVEGGYTETDPVYQSSVAGTITSTDLTNWNIDNDSLNEIQTLSISNDTIFLSNGGFVKIPISYDLVYDYNQITNKPDIPDSLSELVDDILLFNDIDHDTLNEIQTLSISNDTIFLSNGGFVKLPAIYSFIYNYDSIVNKPDIPDSTSELINDAGFITVDLDSDTTNEIQTLSLTNNLLSISGGNSVDLTNFIVDNQQLRVSSTGDTLFISNGNWVKVPGISISNLNIIDIPILQTSTINSVTPYSAEVTAELLNSGYSPLIVKGLAYYTEPNPTTANFVVQDTANSDIFNASLENLEPNTTYYVRSFAVNQVDVYYGNEIMFTTDSIDIASVFNENLDYGTVTDIDNNTYRTIQIGTQEWMAENLKVTRYANGIEIPNILEENEWTNLSSGAWCYYENQSSKNLFYGKLYNWFAVIDTQNVCPTGWHVPTLDDWTTLSNFLAGDSLAGGKLKETSVFFWTAPNLSATNASGFSALPGGFRRRNGLYSVLGDMGVWWSATPYDDSNSWYYVLKYNSAILTKDYYTKKRGYSVRCLRN